MSGGVSATGRGWGDLMDYNSRIKMLRYRRLSQEAELIIKEMMLVGFTENPRRQKSVIHLDAPGKGTMFLNYSEKRGWWINSTGFHPGGMPYPPFFDSPEKALGWFLDWYGQL